MTTDTEEDSLNWDALIDSIMEIIPAKLSHSEWRSLRDNIHTYIWAYVGDIFDESSIEFHTQRDGIEARLFMSISENSEDFQKGIKISDILEKAYSSEPLIAIRDMLDAKIAEMVEQGL